MIRRVFTAFLAEWYKYSRLLLPYIGLITVVSMIAMSLLIHPIRRDNANDFAFIGTAVPGAMNLAGLVMTLVYCATLIASEVESGTIRLVLTRPIQRHEFYLAKLLNGMTYATILSLAAIGAAWMVAIVLGDLNGVAFGDELIHAPDEMYGAMALAFALNLMPQFAAVSYALFISTVTRQPAAAIGVAVVGWLIVDFVKSPFGIASGVFTTYLDQAWIVFQDRANGLDSPFFPAAAQNMIVSLSWFAVFSLAGIFVFGRRSFGP